MAKLTIQDLATVLVTKNGLTEEESQQFMTAIFDVIQMGVERDKLVKIKGLGSFKVVEVDDRESVNVNTGERVLIDGHSKISFTPDSTMKELVNKPFSSFETVVLNDGVDFDEPMKQSRKTAKKSPAKEDIQEAPVVEDVQEEPAEEITLEGPAEEIIQEEPAEEITQEESADEITQEEPAEEVTLEESAEKIIQEEPAEEVTLEESAEEIIQEEPEEQIFVAPAHGEEMIQEEHGVETVVEASEESEVKPSDGTEDKEKSEDKSKKKGKKGNKGCGCVRGCGMVSIVAVICLLIGFLFGFLTHKMGLIPEYDFDIESLLATAPESVAPDSIVKSEVDTLAESSVDTTAIHSVLTQDSIAYVSENNGKDSVQAKTEATVPETTSAETDEAESDYRKYDAMDSRVRLGYYYIAGFDKEVEAVEGDNLARVSYRYFGKGMTCYLAVYNDMSDTTKLKAGQKIKLPKLRARRLLKK